MNDERVALNRRRFFECLQECIESRVGQHVHLIDDVDFVFSKLGRVADLVDQVADVFNRIIGSGIKFKDIE